MSTLDISYKLQTSDKLKQDTQPHKNVGQSGTLLLNLGSPNTSSVSDVRSYLKQFLMDPYVIDYPFILRWLIVHLFILPFRPKRSAAAYQTIWTSKGSPLVVTSKQFRDAVQNHCSSPIEIVMRYGNPSIAHGLKQLRHQLSSLEELLLIPLYPHYADSTWKSCIEEVKHQLKTLKLTPRLKIVKPFYNHNHYINLCASSMMPYLQKPYDHVLFSYHGLPERHLRKADPTGNTCLSQPDCCTNPNPTVHPTCYKAQVVQMTHLLAKRCNIPTSHYSFSFQSRLGTTPWTTPNTQEELIRLAQSHKSRLLIICPSFTVDCLETLEEICIEGKESFLNAGGKSFTYIPCLNTDPKFSALVANWIKNYH